MHRSSPEDSGSDENVFDSQDEDAEDDDTMQVEKASNPFQQAVEKIEVVDKTANNRQTFGGSGSET